jgi:putative membrane-bound dehydrogenase-like protein
MTVMLATMSWNNLVLLHGKSSDTITQSIGQTNFTLPAGYRLELLADDALTTWPMLVDWAPNGDLLVVESGGVASPIEEHNKQLLHRVVRLADTNGDGRWDRRTVVAAQLPLTQGILCVGDDVLITSPPVIYRLSQPDAQGIYQQRDVWFDGQTLTWCANDLHGPFWGHDGWIYWCKGAFAQQTHALVNGGQLQTSAAHIFRRRISGGPLEPVMTGGMDNPNGFAMLPNGERFFTSTFLHHPGGGKRDGLVHALYGGLYGKSHQVLDGHWRTGPLLPVTIELGAAAPAGLIHWELPPADMDAQGHVLVAALYNLQKVTAQILQPGGASYQSRNLDLVVADRIDFHPTDVLPAPDGSLIIVDTGGWYDLCCPTSRVDQKSANGGIYRLVPPATNRALANANQTNANQPNDKRANDNADTSDSLERRLIDPRRWVARRALWELGQADTDITQPLLPILFDQAADPQQPISHRLAWLWGLAAIDTPAATQHLRDLLRCEAPDLVQAACHALSVRRDAVAAPDLETIVRGTHGLGVRRAAAEALGRVGRPPSADVLLAAATESMDDRAWQHALTYALLELGATDAAAAQLGRSDASPWQTLTALTVLDQLGAAQSIPNPSVLALVACGQQFVQREASGILAKHPEWAAAALPQLEAWFADMARPDSDLVAVVAGWRGQPEIQAWVGRLLAVAPTASLDTQRRVLAILAVYRHQAWPSNWEPSLLAWLTQAENPVAADLIRWVRDVPLDPDRPLVAALWDRAAAADSAEQRWEALAALPTGSHLQSVAWGEELGQGLRDELDPDRAGRAAAALERLIVPRQTAQSLLAHLDGYSLRTLGPVLSAVSRRGEDDLDRDALQRLVAVPAARSLSPEFLTQLYRNRSPALQAAAADTAAALAPPLEDVSGKVAEILQGLPPGDALRGLQVFRSHKAACNACHRLGYVGGELGPELSTIGNSRSRAALLEAILFPNARLEQGYRPTQFLTVDGLVYSGLVGERFDAGSFWLHLDADRKILLRDEQIERQEPATVSIMPSGIGEILSVQELADLLEILGAAR